MEKLSYSEQLKLLGKMGYKLPHIPPTKEGEYIIKYGYTKEGMAKYFHHPITHKLIKKEIIGG